MPSIAGRAPNACAFFDNAYLELLWRHDDDELQSDVVRPLGLWERVRWEDTGASPFGIAFRPGDQTCCRPLCRSGSRPRRRIAERAGG